MATSVFSNQLENKILPKIKSTFTPLMLGKVLLKSPPIINKLIVEKILNKTLVEHLNAGEFDFLHDKLLAIEILDANFQLILTSKDQAFKCVQFGEIAEANENARLSIDCNNAIKLIQQEIDPDTLFFQRKLKISGNTELAHHAKNTIDSLSPDLLPKLILKLLTVYQEKILKENEYI